MPQTFIFDFDGTIANILEAMVEIYNQFAHRYRCRVVRPGDLEHLRNGRPKELLAEFGISAWKLPFLVSAVRKGLKSRKLNPQDGIVETLKNLHNKGVTLGILTSNSQENVETFLQVHDLMNVFSFVSSYRHLFGKHKALNKIMRTRHLVPSDVTYIGDEVRDIEAAKKAGIKSVGVTWGFQTLSALKAAAPDMIANVPVELLSLIVSL